MSDGDDDMDGDGWMDHFKALQHTLCVCMHAVHLWHLELGISGFQH
jgi:hypothetical protein